MVRDVVSALLLVVGLVLVGAGVPMAWTERHVLDTARWTQAVAPLIDEPEVQRDVAAGLVAPLVEQLDAGDVAESLLLAVAEDVVATDGFARVWRPTVRISHEHAVEGLRGEGTGLNLAEDGVALDRTALVEALKPRLAEAGVPFAEQIPAGEGTIVLAEGPQVTRAVEVARFVDRVGDRALVGGAAALVLAVLLARRRFRTLTLAGLGVAAVAGLLWLVLGLGGEGTGLLSEVGRRRGTAVLLWEALSASLAQMVVATAVVGGLGALVGVVGGSVHRVREHGRTRRTT